VTGQAGYDEFGLFHENAAEYGLAFDRPLLERTARFNPARSRSSLRRGILHNAEQQPDGTWMWRWARHRHPAAPASPAAGTRYESLWEALSSITVPLLLARGMRPDSVLDDDNERELLHRLPSAQVVHVEEAGHSLQGDAPLELAAIIEQFVFSNVARPDIPGELGDEQPAYPGDGQ
jgi:pimeloyl-ACP methyl ester carboxylesterase